jgi:hypothetical protein
MIFATPLMPHYFFDRPWPELPPQGEKPTDAQPEDADQEDPQPETPAREDCSLAGVSG